MDVPRRLASNLAQKGDKVLRAMLGLAPGQDLARGDVERREEIGRPICGCSCASAGQIGPLYVRPHLMNKTEELSFEYLEAAYPHDDALCRRRRSANAGDDPRYSFRSDSIGSTLLARRAGR
jgi:hypothetical protein